MRRELFYGLLGGVLLALLKVFEYQHFVRTYPTEVYGGLIAIVFSGLGIFLGLRSSRARTASAEARAGASDAPFTVDAAKLAELGITPREHEILGLIAEGLRNREIGERVFISENTVKTHSSRLFDKLGVSNRVQAVRRGKELALLP